MASASKGKKGKKEAPAQDNLTVVMVVDMSGSMMGLDDAVISGYNTYLDGLRKDQEENGGETRVTLCLFDDIVEHPYVALDINKAPALTDEVYHPRGSTALFDATAHSFIETERRLIEEGRENDKVLVVIITDGGENASREYRTEDQIIKLVESYTAKGNYTVSYLGAAHGSLEEAQLFANRIGIPAGNAMMFTGNRASVTSTFNSLSTVTSTRKHSPAMASAMLYADAGSSAADYNVPDGSGPQPSAQVNVDPNSGILVVTKTTTNTTAPPINVTTGRDAARKARRRRQ